MNADLGRFRYAGRATTQPRAPGSPAGTGVPPRGAWPRASGGERRAVVDAQRDRSPDRATGGRRCSVSSGVTRLPMTRSATVISRTRTHPHRACAQQEPGAVSRAASRRAAEKAEPYRYDNKSTQAPDTSSTMPDPAANNSAAWRRSRGRSRSPSPFSGFTHPAASPASTQLGPPLRTPPHPSAAAPTSPIEGADGEAPLRGLSAVVLGDQPAQVDVGGPPVGGEVPTPRLTRPLPSGNTQP